jgi:hypothetical protein
MGVTDEELIKQLREVTGNKLSFTNTPNHLRLTAADRIEQLVATNKQLNKNCEALSQLVDSVSESRDFWMNEYVERYVNG